MNWVDLFFRRSLRNQRRESSARLQGTELGVTHARLNSERCGRDERTSLDKPTVVEPQLQNDAEVVSAKVCVICMEQPANVAFIPCGHVESCKKCARAIHNCHICREAIESRVRVYI